MPEQPVTLDFSKAQPLTLDFSKAQPLPQQGGGAPTQQAAGPQQGAQPEEDHGILGWRDYAPSKYMENLGHSPSEVVHNIGQRISDAPMAVARGVTTGAQRVMTGIRDVTDTHMLDRGIDVNDQFLRATAPKNQKQQENYDVGDQMAGLLLTKWIQEGLSAVQIAKNMKSVPVLTKLMRESPHIAKVIGAGLEAGTANAASTGMMGGSVGDMANAGLTATVLGAAGEVPTAHADYMTNAAGKYKPDVTNIGGKDFIEVSQAARDKGITTQEQEPGLQEQNRQSYESLRDQGLRERAAQGAAETVNAMEPQKPKVSVAGTQRLKAKTSVSTAPPEKANTNASPREIDQSERFLQKIIGNKKFSQAVQDRAQVQLDKITAQKQAVEEWRNNPDNFRTETPVDPKVLLQNSNNFGEFAEELKRHAERRTQDFQWHERQYDANGAVKTDASGNEVWKPVDIKTMSRTQQDASIADGDLAKRDTRSLSKTDVKQGQRLGEIAETAQQLDDITQKIYDLSRERAESIKTQTGQPNIRQEKRTASLQSNIDALEKLAKDKAPDLKDMFGRNDGITDLIAAAKKISYGENGQKYSGTMGDYFLKTLKKRSSMSGKDSFGMGLWAAMKAIGVKHTVVALAGEAATEAAHRSFMHRIATDPDFAKSVLTKDRSPVKGLRISSSTLANLGTQTTVRDAVGKEVQGGAAKATEDID